MRDVHQGEILSQRWMVNPDTIRRPKPPPPRKYALGCTQTQVDQKKKKKRGRGGGKGNRRSDRAGAVDDGDDVCERNVMICSNRKNAHYTNKQLTRYMGGLDKAFRAQDKLLRKISIYVSRLRSTRANDEGHQTQSTNADSRLESGQSHVGLPHER